MFSFQKLKARQTSLARTTAMTDEQKKKWSACLTLDLMSTEESSAENGDSGAHFFVRELPWRSDRVKNFFHSLDHKHTKNQSARSRRMSFERCLADLPSDRPCPFGLPEWMIK